ncbi:DUF1835 domain-containing protein [Algoriphagus lacus]|uniref:DUF1835 domain-containing protein n=1 Tax=Algoriphagus lacus TaxID=2056311 RepID=A0A418PRA8_9BACT|nr:DUF1835 domain-containing protein [Algoriphagus lacus]RIW15160.1 DUF1835 domain-containing protein [Algoriphagus lacus]
MIYHILNGDALAAQFPDSIPGERIIFRECLMDGPVTADSGEEFWKKREDFLRTNFPEVQDLNYQTEVRDEILKIKSIGSDDQIYCWFEEDLFCQVNLWFILNYLKTHPAEVFLVLPYPDSPYHFSTLRGKEIEKAFLTKSHSLNKREREVLGELWVHFQKENIFDALKVAEMFTERFPFIKPAVEAWRDMIPLGDFPGKPKAALIEISQKLQTKDFQAIFRVFQKQLPEYGFGDLQVKRMCKELGII